MDRDSNRPGGPRGPPPCPSQAKPANTIFHLRPPQPEGSPRPVPPLQPIRGTTDLIGEDARRHRHVVDTARAVAATYGCDEWATPIFESTNVFARTLGETSDVVTKEMYSFDRPRR